MTATLRDSELSTFFANLHLCRDKTYSTHGLHPYPAKFIPHIPRELLKTYALPGSPVLDPMCGSGTTLVESALLGLSAIGVDLNPIATLVSRAKTVRLSQSAADALHSFAQQLRDLALDAIRACADAAVPEFHNQEKWFDAQVAREIAVAVGLSNAMPPAQRAVALASISAVLVSVSNQESETRWCAKPKSVDPGETLGRVATRVEMATSRLSSFAAEMKAPVEVTRADARCLPLANTTAGTIVTSPPYANSHDYYLYNKLRLFFLGFEVAPVQTAEIGSRNRHSDLKAPIEHYLDAMTEAFTEWRRVLVDGGRACVVVADAIVRGEFFDMSIELPARAERVGFELDDHFKFDHRQFNATFQRGFGTARNKATHVLVFV